MRSLLFLLLLAQLAILIGCSSNQAEAKNDKDDAALALAEIDALKMPASSIATEQEYLAAYEQAWQKKGPLVVAFVKSHPDHIKAPALMNEYWQSLMKSGMSAEGCEKAIAEIDSQLEENDNDMVRRHGAFWKAYYAAYRDREEPELVLRHSEEFAGEYPDDTRAAALYSLVTASENIDDDKKIAVYERLAKDYPQTQEGQYAATVVRVLPSLNKRFDFDFKEFTSGRRLTTDSFKGKIVVVDFWATWCGPCIAALPHMKKVYEDYKDKGVEFVGVSLDYPEEQGGRQAMSDFLAEHEIAWPQFYMNDDLSLVQRHNVESIPAVFILDRDGVVRSVDGYRVLERTLDKMLAE